MSYATLDNILLDQETLEEFEALARSRGISPQVLARHVITDAVNPRSPKPDLDKFVPRHRATRTRSGERPSRPRRWTFDDLDDERDTLPMPPDPDDEPASERLARRVRLLPL
ncbi:hypothetical protein H0X91_04370 [Burkholderia sp. 9777_1386]|uniref:hypothetical protein n=1 Tax=Burkholderia sp. 9777_1386 TaxID=2751183 RepID=UPI0018C35CBF|nr:hypothetical protein [Burkholderia sp. 9777_1386]MBG0869204.1 hypothetical protein [Burkholderia sp. 9777_1386]